MQLLDPDPTKRGLPRLKRCDGAVPASDAVEPVTTFNARVAVWRIVGQEAGLRPLEAEVGDVLTITPCSKVVGGVVARLLNTGLISSFMDVSLSTPSDVEATNAPMLTPVEAAKARWRARALKESQAFANVLSAAADIDGLPAPPTSDDDGI